KPFSRHPAIFYLRMSLDMPRVFALFKAEHRLTERLVAERGLDCVVSDSRFGVWSREVPSYCILHSLRQLVPFRPRWLEREVERGQWRLLRGFAQILVPDAEAGGGISGELGHDPAIDWGEGRLRYIGPLSGVQSIDVPEDIDYFFSISGVEPHQSMLTRRVLDALPHLRGRIVVTLGKPESAGETRTIGGARVHGYLDRAAQSEMLNRARVVVTRSGYTTLMELAELGKRALLVPTRGQSEQEYLARFHRERGHVWSSTQRELDIPKDLPRAEAAAGMPRISSAHTVRNFLSAIDQPWAAPRPSGAARART
ncbi:MAG TPA: glycosyltransferase, partial [Rhodanobacteraceae bacterium]|nr:glycosyltransferase [Rhodanobacteraceae bacterium]